MVEEAILTTMPEYREETEEDYTSRLIVDIHPLQTRLAKKQTILPPKAICARTCDFD